MRLREPLALIAALALLPACDRIDWSVDWSEVFADLSTHVPKRNLPPSITPGTAKDPEAITEDPLAKPKNVKDGAPTVSRSGVDLGSAIVKAPDGSAPGKKDVVKFAFDAPTLSPRAHQVVYDAAQAEQDAVHKFYADYARSVHFKTTGKDTFTWLPPEGCPNDMGCVYATLIQRSRADVEPIARRFLARVQQAKLNSMATAELLLAFVQAIPYVSPEDPFGLRPPTLTMAEKGGDCDTKSLLLHMLMADLGIDTVIVSSTAHAHTMLAIALPVQGTTFTYQGRRYAFAETTAIGSPIGHINPELLQPNDWRVEFAPKSKDDDDE